MISCRGNVLEQVRVRCVRESCTSLGLKLADLSLHLFSVSYRKESSASVWTADKNHILEKKCAIVLMAVEQNCVLESQEGAQGMECKRMLPLRDTRTRGFPRTQQAWSSPSSPVKSKSSVSNVSAVVSPQQRTARL